MTQPQHEQEAGLFPCDICGMLTHTIEGLCCNCRYKASWPNSSEKCNADSDKATGEVTREQGAKEAGRVCRKRPDDGAPLDKCQLGEKPGIPVSKSQQRRLKIQRGERPETKTKADANRGDVSNSGERPGDSRRIFDFRLGRFV